jgi:hypothetical protein
LNAKVSGIDARIERIEIDIRKIRGQTTESATHAKQILEVVERMDAKQRNLPAPLSVSDVEAKFIRDQLGVKPPTGGPGKIRIGDVLPETLARPLPEDVLAKLPKLRGVRFAIDNANNGIALVESVSNRVFAII